MDLDKGGLSARRQVRAQQGWQGIDVWITIDDVERQDAYGIVCSLLSLDAGLDRPSRVLPTAGGTYVWLRDPDGWRARLQAIADELTKQGCRGSIVAAPIPAWMEPHATATIPTPTLLTLHRLDPPIAATAINDFGQPERGWGVAPAPSRRLMTEISTWVHELGLPVMVGKIAMTPLAPVDTVDVLERVVAEDAFDQSVLAYWPEGGGPRRIVELNNFGATSWSDVDRNTPPLDLALAAGRRAVELAADLDLAVVHPAVAGHGSRPAAIARGLWQINTHLWSSFVPDAFGIQVLTGTHLERASNLDAWNVTEVAPDRFLVQSYDLPAWFEAPDAESVRYARFPDPGLREQARSDFGEMILNESRAAQHPLIPAT